MRGGQTVRPPGRDYAHAVLACWWLHRFAFGCWWREAAEHVDRWCGRALKMSESLHILSARVMVSATRTVLLPAPELLLRCPGSQ